MLFRSVRPRRCRRLRLRLYGVGEKRRAELLKAFKSIKNIKSATLAELEDAVPKNTARAVYDFFHQKGEEPSCE